MPSNAVPFLRYGLLQIGFVAILFANFILTISWVLSEIEETGSETSNKTCIKHGIGIQSDDLVLPLLIASGVLLLTSFCVLGILMYTARTVDLVGNLRMRKRTASFKVAFLSWILTSIETVLRLIALFHFKKESLDDKSNAPWCSIAGYHILVLVQTTFQIFCLYVYEKNTRLSREGQGWFITRKSFLILMAFMNCYLWVLNVAKVKVVVDLTSHNMEKFFSEAVERIIYTLNRASTLAYHVESVQLFYKFYEEDSISPVNDHQYEDLDHEYPDYGNQIVETDSGKGIWPGFFLFGISLAFAVGSFLVRRRIDEIHYLATLSTVGIMLTIFCITLKTTMSDGNSEDEERRQWHGISDMFEEITSYMAGEQVSHLRVLLFYSICAVSYHFLLTIRVSIRGGEIDLFQPVREGCKGIACICLTVFMFWMSHEKRKLRCWCDLNVMFWAVMTLLALELVEEAFEHDNLAKESLQIYALPLAIDFKTYVIIHTFSDITTAKTDYRRELRRNVTAMTANSNGSRTSTPLLI